MKPTRFKRIQHKVEVAQNTLIPVSWLHTYGYCEYQLYLEKALGVEAPPTPEMLTGTHRHNYLDDEHEKKAEIALTVPEAAQKAQFEAVVMVSRDISVRGKSLFGRIDEVAFEPNRIIIIDDKPTALPYFSNRLQVWGYCQAFYETYSPEVPLFGAIRQEDSGNIAWFEPFKDEYANLVQSTVSRIQAILSGSEIPQPSGNSKKCKPCRFKRSCPVTAGGESRSQV